MEISRELNLESKKYYTQFLGEILPAVNEALNATLNDSRANSIEECYFKATSFSSWRQILLIDTGDSCKEIYNELQSDLAASISSAMTGNYRLAFMSIRSFIELSSLLAYYYYHPVEYSWWLNDNHLIKFSELNQNYFKYYKQLVTNTINTNIYSEWKKVSKYVHAEVKSYMQSSDNLAFLPVYQKDKLGQWIFHFSQSTMYINQLFYIVFQDAYYKAFSKIEFDSSCQIIKNNLNDETFFLNIKEARCK
ncbi:hypothetical protein [Nostoc sp.]|uniref:hypothetical protein n=2 Tax=Nostoc sp. TaxID=1180 RepID=UPI002FFA4682